MIKALTVVAGDIYEALAEIAVPFVAKHTGIEPIVIRPDFPAEAGKSERHLAIVNARHRALLEIEEPVLCFDVDWLLLRPWNISEYENTDGFHAYREDLGRQSDWARTDAQRLGVPYFNAGVFIIGRDKRPLELMLRVSNEELGFQGTGDQSRLNWSLKQLEFPTYPLHQTYNKFVRGDDPWYPDGVIGVHIMGTPEMKLEGARFIVQEEIRRQKLRDSGKPVSTKRLRRPAKT